MKRILIVTTFDYPHQGGLSSHIDLLRKGYSYHGVQTDVISLSSLPKFQRKWLRRVLVGPFYFLNRSFGIYLLHLLTCFLMKRIIRRAVDRFDAVHFHEISKLVDRSLSKCTILTVHADFTNMAVGDGLLKEGELGTRRFLEIEKQAYLNATRIFAVDERLRRHVEFLSGRTDVYKQINFVDVDEFALEKSFQAGEFKKKNGVPLGKKSIICPRRFVQKNGVIYALEALRRLPDEFILLLIGNGPEMKVLHEYVDRNHLKGKVFFFHQVQRDEMKFFYWISDYVLIPSITVSNGMQEATSIAAIEGMAAAKIVIASAIGGLKELISNGENGFLFPEKDVLGVCSIINAMEGDSMQAENIRNRARNSVLANFDYRVAVKNILMHISSNR